MNIKNLLINNEIIQFIFAKDKIMPEGDQIGLKSLDITIVGAMLTDKQIDSLSDSEIYNVDCVGDNVVLSGDFVCLGMSKDELGLYEVLLTSTGELTYTAVIKETPNPIQRRTSNDKTIMPLRGEGNQPDKAGINFDQSTCYVDIVNGAIVGGGGGYTGETRKYGR